MKIKGLDKLLKDLKAFGVEGEKMILGTTKVAAEQIAGDAKVTVSRQSADTGGLGQSIQTEKIGDLTYKIGSRLPYSGYIEFGTGAKVDVPAELTDVAETFRGGGGSFEDGLDAIRAWCKRKGIPIEAAYPILVSLINNGMSPKPFLYPAFVQGREQYIKDLEGDLKELTKI